MREREEDKKGERERVEGLLAVMLFVGNKPSLVRLNGKRRERVGQKNTVKIERAL